MSDVMLLGVLRMPIPDEPDPLTLRQFVARARQAADRIEADAAEIAHLRATLTMVADVAHTHRPGPVIGSTVPLPPDQWPRGYTEDPDCPGMGTWWCPHCECGKPPNVGVEPPERSARTTG